jgi:histidinol-phosphatase (PHP family)
MIDEFYAVDYQVHSFCSHDGRASLRDQCLRAVEIGLDEIGFSEHKDFDPEDPAVNYFDYEYYRSEVEKARAEFAGALKIRMGVEVDYQRWFEDQIADYLQRHPFDFVIGSVHYVDSVPIMSDVFLKDRSVTEAYSLYFQAVYDSVRSGMIDIVGHLEYANRRAVPRLGAFNPGPYREQIKQLYTEMIRQGVALEINTAGLRQGVGHTYPCEEHVRLYAECGGAIISLGSDSHHPDDLAESYTVAANLSLRYGLTKISTWENRVRTEHPLRSA